MNEKKIDHGWFSYDPGEGFEFHDTADDAKEKAEEALSYYASEAGGDGWDLEVWQVCWGRVLEKAEETMRKSRPAKEQLDENGYDIDGRSWGSHSFDEIVDYDFREPRECKS